MPESAQALRLHILMEPPDIVWVYDRLRVVGLIPHWSLFRCRDNGLAFLVVHLLAVDDRLATFLVARLQQIPKVRAVRARRRSGHETDAGKYHWSPLGAR